MVVCNDATVKGGAYFPLTVKKQLRAQEIRTAEPAALRVPRRFGRSAPPEAMTRSSPTGEHFGRIFYNQANMSAAGVPQVAVVIGLVHRGRRLRPGDERREHHRGRAGRARVFLGGPPLVKGGDRGGGSRPRRSAARTCTRANRGVTDTLRGGRRARPRPRPPRHRQHQPGEKRIGAAHPGAGPAALRPRGDPGDHPPRRAPALRPCAR